MTVKSSSLRRTRVFSKMLLGAAIVASVVFGYATFDLVSKLMLEVDEPIAVPGETNLTLGLNHYQILVRQKDQSASMRDDKRELPPIQWTVKHDMQPLSLTPVSKGDMDDFDGSGVTQRLIRFTTPGSGTSIIAVSYTHLTLPTKA